MVFRGGNKKSVIRYFILAAVLVAFSAAFTKLLAMLFGASVPILQTLIKILVDTALFFASYTVQKKWVFADKK